MLTNTALPLASSLLTITFTFREAGSAPYWWAYHCSTLLQIRSSAGHNSRHSNNWLFLHCLRCSSHITETMSSVNIDLIFDLIRMLTLNEDLSFSSRKSTRKKNNEIFTWVNPTSHRGCLTPPSTKTLVTQCFRGLGCQNFYFYYIWGWYRFQIRHVPPFWSLVRIFRVQIFDFSDILGVLWVRLDWDKCSNIYLGPMDHSQPLLGLVFINF